MEETENLSFSGNDPGAVQHGNFINYYSFHTTSQRMSNLNTQMFPCVYDGTVVCLDIGCNTGDLTKCLKIYLKTIYPNSIIKILAIDIDSSLINRAIDANSDSDIIFTTANVMSERGGQVIKEYLKSNNKTNFDMTFCFSVTMWIHLNSGDKGLIRFLEFVKSITKLIIIEPQPWKCYRSAQRRMKKSGGSFELYKTLKIKSDVLVAIENILTRNGHEKLCESSLSSWDRKIQSYLLRHLN